jgi:hypothetical protein
MRRQKQCVHGIVETIRCWQCALLDKALERAIAERKANAPLVESIGGGELKCAICLNCNHVSKFCPATAVGRERIARSA